MHYYRYLVLGSATPATAMHIAEGFLPWQWVIFWWAVALPFLVVDLRSLTRITTVHPELKLLLALSGAFTFVLSALKIPSVTGSLPSPRCPEVSVSFQCESQRTQSRQVRVNPTAFRRLPLCLVDGQCQTANVQSPPLGMIYLQLRPRTIESLTD